MNLVVFYVWENAKIWAHWNHSFDMHLSSLRPVSCSFPFWVPSGCTLGGGCNGWGLGSRQPICHHPEFPQGSPVGAEVADGLTDAASFVSWYGRQHFSFTLFSSFILFPFSSSHQPPSNLIFLFIQLLPYDQSRVSILHSLALLLTCKFQNLDQANLLTPSLPT